MATLNVKQFPDDLYERIKQRAAVERRSTAGEITHLLEQAMVEASPLSILELRGLGKESWRGVSAADHVGEEREAWE